MIRQDKITQLKYVCNIYKLMNLQINLLYYFNEES